MTHNTAANMGETAKELYRIGSQKWRNFPTRCLNDWCSFSDSFAGVFDGNFQYDNSIIPSIISHVYDSSASHGESDADLRNLLISKHGLLTHLRIAVVDVTNRCFATGNALDLCAIPFLVFRELSCTQVVSSWIVTSGHWRWCFEILTQFRH